VAPAPAAAQAAGGKPPRSKRPPSTKQPPQLSPEQQLALKRRQAALASMMVMVDGVEDAQQFTKLAAPLSGAELEQVCRLATLASHAWPPRRPTAGVHFALPPPRCAPQVAEERALAGACGNPLCPSPCTWRAERTVLRPTPTSIREEDAPAQHFCGPRCEQLIQQCVAAPRPAAPGRALQPAPATCLVPRQACLPGSRGSRMQRPCGLRPAQAAAEHAAARRVGTPPGWATPC
jgi:hypothetical protein